MDALISSNGPKPAKKARIKPLPESSNQQGHNMPIEDPEVLHQQYYNKILSAQDFAMPYPEPTFEQPQLHYPPITSSVPAMDTEAIGQLSFPNSISTVHDGTSITFEDYSMHHQYTTFEEWIKSVHNVNLQEWEDEFSKYRREYEEEINKRKAELNQWKASNEYRSPQEFIDQDNRYNKRYEAYIRTNNLNRAEFPYEEYLKIKGTSLSEIRKIKQEYKLELNEYEEKASISFDKWLSENHNKPGNYLEARKNSYKKQYKDYKKGKYENLHTEIFLPKRETESFVKDSLKRGYRLEDLKAIIRTDRSCVLTRELIQALREYMDSKGKRSDLEVKPLSNIELGRLIEEIRQSKRNLLAIIPDEHMSNINQDEDTFNLADLHKDLYDRMEHLFILPGELQLFKTFALNKKIELTNIQFTMYSDGLGLNAPACHVWKQYMETNNGVSNPVRTGCCNIY